jgi:hypothetical protein
VGDVSSDEEVRRHDWRLVTQSALWVAASGFDEHLDRFTECHKKVMVQTRTKPSIHWAAEHFALVWEGAAWRQLSSCGGDWVTGTISGRRKPSSFEEYWRASIAWQRKGPTLSAGRALANAGFLSVQDLQNAQTYELAMVPRIGAKSLALLASLRA